MDTTALRQTLLALLDSLSDAHTEGATKRAETHRAALASIRSTDEDITQPYAHLTTIEGVGAEFLQRALERQSDDAEVMWRTWQYMVICEEGRYRAYLRTVLAEQTALSARQTRAIEAIAAALQAHA